MVRLGLGMGRLGFYVKVKLAGGSVRGTYGVVVGGVFYAHEHITRATATRCKPADRKLIDGDLVYDNTCR